MLFLWVVSCLPVHTRADGIDYARRKYPWSFFHTEYLQQLNDNWEIDGRPESVPFEFYKREEASFTSYFCSPDSVGDSVYLYFEGLAWNGELILNDRYLGVYQRPFEPWKIPVHISWLNPDSNKIKLNLFYGTSPEWYPEQFIGVFRPVYLLNKAQVARIEKPLMKKVATADTIGIVAPYYGNKGYVFDGFYAARNLYLLKKHQIRHIYFPFEPGRKLQALCAEAGFTRVDSLNRESRICIVNAYKYEPSVFPWIFSSWLDLSGQRTSDFGEMFMTKGIFTRRSEVDNRLWFGLLVFLPLLQLFFLKIASPGFFYSLFRLTIKPQLYIDSGTEGSGAQQGLLLVLHIIRLLSMSLFLTLGIYLVDIYHQWDLLNVIRDHGFMFSFFYGSKGLGWIFARSIIAVMGWFALKHAMILFIGRIFRIKGMVDGLLNLEIVSTYPLILVLPVPVAFLLVADPVEFKIILGMLILIALSYYLRRLYVLYVGLDRLFGFSSGMKILYICTFNIFAYLIWL